LNILALETSERRASVALMVDAHLRVEHRLDLDVRTAQALVPAIAESLASLDWHPRDIGLVAVTTGPGSFTGLRIGVTMAKTFAYATGAAVRGVNTLEVIAAQSAVEGELTAVIDAQRNQLYCGRLRRDDQGEVHWLGATEIVDVDDWRSALQPGEVVSGPVLQRLADRLPQGVVVVDRSNWSPRAETVGRLAWRDAQAGRLDDLWLMVPQYFRPSAAEEKWAKRRQATDGKPLRDEGVAEDS